MLVERETILEEKNVCYLEPMGFDEVIKTLLETIDHKDQVSQIFEKILERENVVSTSVGKGLAIPHGRCNFVDSFHLMVGICPKGSVGWHLIDNVPIQIICLLVGPENRQREYLLHLANITSLLKEEKIRFDLLFSEEKKMIVNIFNSC